MARFVEGKFDSFKSDGSIGAVEKDADIRFPHYIARMLVKQRDDARRNGHNFNSVQWIKFVREWHQEHTGHSLGLKDAKDIVDHYNNISDAHNHLRPAHLQF